LDTCGNQWTVLDQSAYSPTEVTPYANIAAGETCTLKFKFYGVNPGLLIKGGSSFATSGVEAYLYTYTLDDRLSTSSSNGNMPAYGNTLHDITAVCAVDG